ncbi:hypothetical protein T190611E02C_30028 [Tenacibaculum sp. 190524A05c]
MKKSILNFGKVLEKAEQKQINGGARICSGWECDMWDYFPLKPNCICEY